MRREEGHVDARRLGGAHALPETFGGAGVVAGGVGESETDEVSSAGREGQQRERRGETRRRKQSWEKEGGKERSTYSVSFVREFGSAITRLRRTCEIPKSIPSEERRSPRP
jgi:hypothetical protein